MTREQRFPTAKVLLAAVLTVLVSTTAHSRLKLELTGRSAPEDTREFTEAYKDCTDGLLNVDLASGEAMASVDLSLKYRPAPLYTENDDAGLRAYFTTPSYMIREGAIFRLVSIQFHVPGDNIAEQGTYPLMAHFVHYGQDSSFGVLAVRFTEGAANPELAKLISAAAGSEKASGVNPRLMLPAQLDVPYSLGPGNVPSCDYKLHWYFAGEPVQASAEQIAQVRQLLTSGES